LVVGSSVFTVYSVLSDTFSVTVASGSLNVQISNDGGTTWKPQITSGTTSIPYTAYASAGTYDFRIKVSGTNGKLIVKDTSDIPTIYPSDPNNNAYNIYDTTIQSPSANIPEFPTVAAPVAAVLGLLFVFGRKKGGL